MHIRLPNSADVRHKRVVMRVDFNVPLSEVGPDLIVGDDERIKAILPTLDFLEQHQAQVILLAHLGRPEKDPDPKLSLQPVVSYFNEVLKRPMVLVSDWQSQSGRQAIDEALHQEQLVLLENLRFHPEEEKNDSRFAQQLASLGQVYINDAFSVSHRAHASVAAITDLLPSFGGLSLDEEVQALSSVADHPQRPLVAIIGGAKISDKAEAVANLAHLADHILIGGGVANLFLKAEGLEIHKSYMQDAPADLKKKGINYLHVAHDLLDDDKRGKILYPLDVVAAASPDSTTTEIIELTPDLKDTPNDKNLMYLDIGPKTIHLYQEIMKDAQTIFWNGPLGVFEKPTFAKGSRAIAQAMADSSAHTIVGGGDTVAAIEQFKLGDDFSYVSHAGGASLDFLAGKKLPGLIPLAILKHE